MRAQNYKTKDFDNSFLTDNIKYIAGIDEAGRGPLAGPVIAAAVIFERDVLIDGVKDSKKLNEKKRTELFGEIVGKAASFGIGIVEHDEIDRINILQATLKAMKSASEKLNPEPHLILIDGNKSFFSDIPVRTIIKGDQKSFAIAAASIIAKVTRDNIMKEMSFSFPNYYWAQNKGYATKQHINAIKRHGASEYHRQSFLSRILESGEQIKLL